MMYGPAFSLAKRTEFAPSGLSSPNAPTNFQQQNYNRYASTGRVGGMHNRNKYMNMRSNYKVNNKLPSQLTTTSGVDVSLPGETLQQSNNYYLSPSRLNEAILS